MMPAEGDGGAVGRSGRKSRANAGARLKDILQQEAKDLRTLEAEADQETEETAHAVGTKKARQRHQQAHPDEGVGLVTAANGTPQANFDEPQPPAPGTADNDPTATVKSEPELDAAANGVKARKKPAHVEDAAAVAATPAAAPAPRAIRAPLQRLPRPTRGPDEGSGAALGQALGAADTCWSASKEAGAATKQQLQQQRGTKRKRAGKAGTPPPEGTDAGTEDGEEAAVAASNNGSGVVAQQPVGKVLPVGSRPSWLVQAVEGGSTALNKRQAKALVDDLSQPQQVEFMMGCASCDYQQHGCAECRVRPEVSRPMARWQPDSGHPQVDLGDAATFTPSKEEFADPFAYIASIAEQFVKQGIAKIVPPPGCWASPAYVQQLKAACSSGGSDCSVAEGLVFNAQRQFLSHLCMRAAAAVGNGTVATAAGAGPSSSQCQAPSVEQLLGPDVELLCKLEQQADAGPANPLAAAEGHPAAQQGSRASAGLTGDDDAGQATTAAAAAAATSQGQPDHTVAVKQEAGVVQQQLDGLEQPQPQPQQQPSSVCTHTLRSFAAYADWAKRMHFSCQPCNAELHAVLQPTAAAQGRQRQSSMTGLPPAKRPKPDADHVPQPSRDTGTEAEGTEDTDMDGAAESNRDVAQQHPPERHSSRLQAKGRAPLHPLKATAGSGRGASPEPAAAKAKASKAATSTTSATPPTTPRTKAVKSGSGTRLVGAAAGMLGLAAVFPESAISMDQFEAEFWRVVEQQQPGRLVEAVYVPELRSNSSSSTVGGSSLVQELQEQLDWTYDQLQQEAGAPEAGAWDLSSLPCRRENLLRYLPLQQAISGLTEPVLGLSSCLSSCCWQLTPQGMYGISCLHSGAPRVWYAVPESACDAFQVALQDCLPHLFAANPALLQQAVTAVSPNELRARGVPVCRLIQEPGTFVVLLPNAFHSWVSTGFSIHESVALAPWDCLGAGCDAERSSRQQRHPTAVSQTELLVTLVSSCRCVADAHGPGGGDIEAEADEQATAVATAALAAVSKARTQQSTKAGKQQPHQQRQQQQEQPAGAQQGEAASEQAGQQAAASGGKQQQRSKQQQSNRQQQRQRQKSLSQRKPRATAADSDSSDSHGDGGSGSDADAVSAESLALSSDSSSSSSSGSSSSSEGSDSEAEASQPCWGAAAGAQQLLEPGLAWASGACASAALELVPKPAILAAVGELVLRVEEEQCRQAVARLHGIKQEQRMHGAVLPVSHCGVCCTDLWLSAVVSSEAPGQAVCPEHAAALSAAPDSCTLLFRHSVEELQRLLFEAAALFPGCADDIRAAQQRVRTRPVIRGLKSLGPVLPLSQELPAPRAPELKPGGREPATPTADWVKQLMALATARLPLVGHGAAARLPHRQRRGAVEEALQVAAAAFEAVKADGSIEAVSLGQKLPVRHVRRKDDAVQMVVQQLLRQGVSSKASKGKGGQQQQQPQQPDSEASGSDDEAEGGDQRKERAPLQPRQRKLPGWLQSECVVDKAVAKRAKGGPAGSKGSKAGANATGGAADRSGGEGKAAVAVAFSLAEVVPLAEQALEVVAAQRALLQQQKQQRRQQQEQRKQQRLQEQQYEQQQEQRRQRQQQEHRMGNGVTHSVAQQQLHQLQQQQLLALQQQSQQLLLAAAPASQHRPPQARASRESLREGGSSGGRPKGRGGGRGAGGRGERRSSTAGGRRGMAGAVAGVGTEQQQQLAAQLTLQQLQLQAQFRAAALAAAAAAAGQGAPAAATVPAVSSAAAAAAGGQLGQAGGAGVPGFVGFPGPLITMHNGVPVLIFAAPLPQQQSGSTAATASADPAAQSAAAAAAAPVEAGDEVQQMGQQQQLGQGQQVGQQQQQEQQLNHIGAAPTSSAVPAAAANAAPGSLASPSAPQASAGAAAATPAASDAVAGAAAAAAGPSPGAGDAPAHSCGLLPASSMQHSSGQLTDAEAAAAAAHAEAEAVASRAAAEAVAAAAAEARLVAGIVGNGHHHPQGPAVSAAAAPALAAGNTPGSQPVLQHQQPTLMSPGPAASAAPVGAPSAAMGSAEAAAAPVTMALQPAAYLAWQLPPLAPPAGPLVPASTSAPAAGAALSYGVSSSTQLLASLSAPGQAVHVDHGPAVSTAPPVECMLQVEEFFHSQEPGHADTEAAAPPAPEQPAAAQAPAAAGGGPYAVPAAGPEATTTAAVTTAAPDAWLVPAAASELPCSSAGAMELPAQAVAAASTAAIGWQAAQAEAGSLQVLEQQHEANAVPAATQTATGGTAADAAGSMGPPAAQDGTCTAALAPAVTAGAGFAPVAVAAPARAPAPQAAAGQRTAGAGGPSGDDEMDELELEPLVDGMDDFDW